MSALYKFVHPIVRRFTTAGSAEAREETVAEVTVRRMTGGDIRAMGALKTETDQSMLLIERLTGLSKSDVDKLDAEDIAGIGAVVDDFLPASLKTGDKQSGS